jgi:hypothetical protein
LIAAIRLCAVAESGFDGQRTGVTAKIEMGSDPTGRPVVVDVEELLATRLLVQGNSGSGKSHLLRRLLEESAHLVQQVIIDPEGDFASLAQEFGHIVVDAGDYNEREITRIASRIREHRASVVLNLESLEVEAQMHCAATFLNTLFDAPRDQWYPALVVVDEAQLFAPAAAGDVSDAARRVSLSAMTNLMCRGRKRGLAGVIATQRLAKLAKNVAAEASNFLMGRTFLDIDMARAADLLGMERRQAEQIRDLDRGSFIGLGPAITRRPVAVKIGAVKTSTRTGTQGLLPMPAVETEEFRTMLFAEMEEDAPPPRYEASTPRVGADELIRRFAEQEQTVSVLPDPMRAVAQSVDGEAPAPAPTPQESVDIGALVVAVLEDMLADPDCHFQSSATLYQDFTVRCRMRRLSRAPLELSPFRKRFALAQAGIFDPTDPQWGEMLATAQRLPEDMLAPFALIARSAMEGAPCPEDEALGRVYGSSSPGRIRRLLDYMEKQGAIVVRTDFSGKRSIVIPELGLSTSADALG